MWIPRRVSSEKFIQVTSIKFEVRTPFSRLRHYHRTLFRMYCFCRGSITVTRCRRKLRFSVGRKIYFLYSRIRNFVSPFIGDHIDLRKRWIVSCSQQTGYSCELASITFVQKKKKPDFRLISLQISDANAHTYFLGLYYKPYRWSRLDTVRIVEWRTKGLA